jgi:sulfopyruvate decarboxylase subunit beta
VKRLECLQLLASWTDAAALTVTSLTSNARMWATVGADRPSFYGMNMGLCLPFAVGLCLAFPGRRVVALDSDGSLMVDTSSLVTAAEVSPPNLLALVFDNERYASMGDTATSRRADLEAMARGAGVPRTATLRTLEEFEAAVKPALADSAFSLYVVKIEPEQGRFKSIYDHRSERAMKESFLDAIRQFPDYREGE